MSNPNWGRQGVKPNDTCGRDTYDNGTLFVDYNKVTLYVMLYEKNIDNDKLKFWVWQDKQNSVINSNKYIIMGGIEVNNGIILNVGSQNPLPKLHSCRQSTNQITEQNWYDCKYSNVWEIKQEV